MFLYFFLVITAVYIIKPVRNALFLDALGAQNLRFVYMGEGVFLIFVVAAYVHLAKMVSRKILHAGVLLFFITNLIAFWFLFHTHSPVLVGLFYVWAASFSITLTTQFWTLANDIYSTSEAKRLFGIIISGGSAGGIVGGLLTGQAVHWMPTEDLLLVAAGILGLCLALMVLLWKVLPRGLMEPEPIEKETSTESPIKLLLGSPYLLMLAGIVIFAKMASTIADNQFNRVVEMVIVGKEAKTAFFGVFNAWLNGFSFFMQFFMTGLCLRYLGVSRSLWMLPVGLAIGSGFTFFSPVLLASVLLKMYDGSMNYSIQQATKEVLYLPVPSAVRYRVKPVIDMLGFRAAKSLAGVYIAIFAFLFAIPDEKLGILVLSLIPFWLFFLWRMKRWYIHLLREQLLKKFHTDKHSPTTQRVLLPDFLHDGKSLEEIQSFTRHPAPDVRRIAAMTCLVFAEKSQELSGVKALVEEITQDQRREQAPSFRRIEEHLGRYPERAVSRLKKLLTESKLSIRAKRRALRLLARIPRQEAFDTVLRGLREVEGMGLGCSSAQALRQICEGNSKIAVPRSAIKKEIARMALAAEEIEKLRYLHCRSHKKNKKKDDYLDILLKALGDETSKSIFDYLTLLYPQEAMDTIYKRLSEAPEADPIRAVVAEFFSNMLEPDVFISVHKVLERRDFPHFGEREAVDILKRFFRSKDRSFAFTGYWVGSEMGLYDRWPELAKLQPIASFRGLP